MNESTTIILGKKRPQSARPKLLYIPKVCLDEKTKPPSVSRISDNNIKTNMFK